MCRGVMGSVTIAIRAIPAALLVSASKNYRSMLVSTAPTEMGRSVMGLIRNE